MKLSLGHRTLAVAGCTASWEGRCGQVPVFAHRLLGGCRSRLSVSGLFLGSVLIATAHALLWTLFRQCSESLLLVHPETVVSRLLGTSRLLSQTPSQLAVVH